MNIRRKNNIYIEGNPQIGECHLDAPLYARAIEAMIIVCSDAIIIDQKTKVFFLPRRAVKPMKGFWSIGGRRHPGENAATAITRIFKRDTSLNINSERFQPSLTIEVIWKDRKESPPKVGKHDVIQLFTIELTNHELETAHLNLRTTEYELGSLTPFNREKIIEKQLHPALLDMYDTVFPNQS